MGGRAFQAEGTAREKILKWERTWQSSEGVLGSENLIGKELESTGRFYREERMDAFQTTVPPSPIYLSDLTASFPSPSHTAGLVAFHPLQATITLSPSHWLFPLPRHFPPDSCMAHSLFVGLCSDDILLMRPCPPPNLRL